MKSETVIACCGGLHGNSGARLALVCCLALGFGLRSQAANFTSFDVPPGGTLSNGSPIVINANGVIAGTYNVALPCGPCGHAFVRAANGAVTSFDAPEGAWYTIVEGMNTSGAITGFYKPLYSNNNRSFIRSADGNSFISFDPVQAQYVDSHAMSINTAGAVTGYFQNYADGTPPPTHSFVRAADGTITVFDVPNATGTYATSINDSGVITGFYENTPPGYHAFVRAADGTITTFDAKTTNIFSTVALSVSLSGDIAGIYADVSPTNHGFLRTTDGKIDRFDVLHAFETVPVGMSPSGIITGWYGDAAGGHGFVRQAGKNGKFTTFDVSFGSNATPTTVLDDGTVAGWYWDLTANAPKPFFGKP